MARTIFTRTLQLRAGWTEKKNSMRAPGACIKKRQKERCSLFALLVTDSSSLPCRLRPIYTFRAFSHQCEINKSCQRSYLFTKTSECLVCVRAELNRRAFFIQQSGEFFMDSNANRKKCYGARISLARQDLGTGVLINRCCR